MGLGRGFLKAGKAKSKGLPGESVVQHLGFIAVHLLSWLGRTWCGSFARIITQQGVPVEQSRGERKAYKEQVPTRPC